MIYVPLNKYLILTESNGVIGAGTIMSVTKDYAVPEGWLECDGREYDPEEYPQLHETLTIDRPICKKRTLWQRLLRRPAKVVGYESIGVYGKNRLPDLRGQMIVVR